MKKRSSFNSSTRSSFNELLVIKFLIILMNRENQIEMVSVSIANMNQASYALTSRPKSILVFIVFAVTLLAIIGLEEVFREPLIRYTLAVVPKW